ncbi:MAG TPA: hypothetical protein VFB80_07415 [Pirellulaceae bacterium]|nr:hypothetical protein [Pirellulaceae bacterium]
MNISPLERRVLAIGTAVVLHAAILGLAAAVHAAAQAAGRVPALPQGPPLLLAAVALVMAHCSLGAIWWARSNWPSYAKTLVAVLATAALWALLIGVLESTDLAETAAAAWAASLATQVVLVGLGAALLELLVAPPGVAERSRFTILILLLWTAVVGVLLGAGRRLAQALGWNLADVLRWQWFYQLQMIGVSNAALAVSLLVAVRLRREWTVRLLVAGLALFFVGLVPPLAMTAMFKGNLGASFADVAWLLLVQGLFVLATLAPLEAAKELPK